ncbi:hypothetical protein BDZ91DRAFT_736979 [Kalaharituber pfeilii]|nr:hypothetical protein BDZ91DRAFT_736979 [Kalaharituber pfeilii]
MSPRTELEESCVLVPRSWERHEESWEGLEESYVLLPKPGEELERSCVLVPRHGERLGDALVPRSGDKLEGPYVLVPRSREGLDNQEWVYPDGRQAYSKNSNTEVISQANRPIPGSTTSPVSHSQQRSNTHRPPTSITSYQFKEKALFPLHGLQGLHAHADTQEAQESDEVHKVK